MGFSFPFMSNPASLLGLFSNKDIEILEFHPPPLTFTFSKNYIFTLYTPPDVNLVLTFGASVTVDYALVLGKLIVCSIFSLVIST